MEKKLQKLYPGNYNSLIVQGLWLPHYLILLIKFIKFIKERMKEFIKSNANMDI